MQADNEDRRINTKGGARINYSIMKYLLMIIVGIPILLCTLLYLFQERLIFFPEKLPKDFKFNFTRKFEEVSIRTTDQKLLSGLLFRSDSSRGLIFYLHGNAGSLSSWGEVAQTYTSLHYDVFMLDYRGYGKSDGAITSQEQFYEDIQMAYSEMLKNYDEDKIIVLGYSVGTGPATKLASTNNPKLLILQAPYFSLVDMMKYFYSFIPAFILKYKFETNEYIKDCKMPIVIFHGRQDEVIYYGSSLKLKELLKKSDILITLEGQGHNGMSDNPVYRMEVSKILNR